MDGLHEVAASGVVVPIGGTEYLLMPLRAKDWGEAARYLNKLRVPPLEVVKQRIAGMEEADRKHLLDLAYRDERDGDLLDMGTVQKWFLAPEGAAYKLWLTIRQKHPDVTLDRCGELLKVMSDQEEIDLARSARATDGLPEGNSSGLS